MVPIVSVITRVDSIREFSPLLYYKYLDFFFASARGIRCSSLIAALKVILQGILGDRSVADNCCLTLTKDRDH